MTITKLVSSDSFDFDDSQASFVPVHSGGVDAQWQRKHAQASGVFAKELANIRPQKGKTVIHVIALGDEEVWGPNRNCDAFSRADNISCHPTFVNLGHVFRNHKNSDPALSCGKVLASAHNDAMSRVELLLELLNDKCPKEVDALEMGKDCPVSMGCFPAGHSITLDDGSTILLEEVKVGDRVLTHTGTHRVVTHVFEHDPYTGLLYKFVAPTVSDIEATEEHPFFIVPAEAITFANYKAFRVNPEALKTIDVAKDGVWVQAKDVKVGDYFVTPVNMVEELPDYMSVALARILGYYAAEGYVRMTPEGRFCSVGFSVNRKDAAVEEIPRRCAELGISADKIRIRESTSSEHCLSIVVTDSELAFRCADLCGKLAKQKKFSQELMLLPVAYQLEFLGALINGDGCAGSGAQTGALYISTASPYYRDQLRHLLARVGVIPGLNTIRHQAGVGKSTYSTTEFQVYVPKTDAYILAPFTVKGVRTESNGRRGGRRVRAGNFILTPIASVSTRAVVEEPIFNIEVEGENSFVINNIAVHNSSQEYDTCSYCGHKAPTAADHCSHITDHLGEVLEDGQRIYMKNPNPRFFDISLVYKPADRIAYTLRKVALSQGVIGGHELAAAAGLDGSRHPKFATMQALARHIKTLQGKGVKVDAAELGPKAKDAIKLASSRFGIEKVLALLSQLGVLLSPTDFAETVVGHPCPDCCAAAIQQNSKSFDDLLDDHTQIPAFEAADSGDARLPDDVVSELLQAGGMQPENVANRIIRITIIRPTSKLAQVLPDVEADAVARLYAHYKVAFAHSHQNNPAILRMLAATF